MSWDRPHICCTDVSSGAVRPDWSMKRWRAVHAECSRCGRAAITRVALWRYCACEERGIRLLMLDGRLF